MNPIEWNSLSDEEKAALIEMCKEDPVVFIETVCGMELMEYQKIIVRGTFKALRKQDRLDMLCTFNDGVRAPQDPSNKTCRTCKHRDGWRQLEPCRSCRGFSNWEERK